MREQEVRIFLSYIHVCAHVNTHTYIHFYTNKVVLCMLFGMLLFSLIKVLWTSFHVHSYHRFHGCWAFSFLALQLFTKPLFIWSMFKLFVTKYSLLKTMLQWSCLCVHLYAFLGYHLRKYSQKIYWVKEYLIKKIWGTTVIALPKRLEQLHSHHQCTNVPTSYASPDSGFPHVLSSLLIFFLIINLKSEKFSF